MKMNHQIISTYSGGNIANTLKFLFEPVYSHFIYSMDFGK